MKFFPGMRLRTRQERAKYIRFLASKRVMAAAFVFFLHEVGAFALLIMWGAFWTPLIFVARDMLVVMTGIATLLVALYLAFRMCLDGLGILDRAKRVRFRELGISKQSPMVRSSWREFFGVR